MLNVSKEIFASLIFVQESLPFADLNAFNGNSCTIIEDLKVLTTNVGHSLSIEIIKTMQNKMQNFQNLEVSDRMKLVLDIKNLILSSWRDLVKYDSELSNSTNFLQLYSVLTSFPDLYALDMLESDEAAEVVDDVLDLLDDCVNEMMDNYDEMKIIDSELSPNLSRLFGVLPSFRNRIDWIAPSLHGLHNSPKICEISQLSDVFQVFNNNNNMSRTFQMKPDYQFVSMTATPTKSTTVVSSKDLKQPTPPKEQLKSQQMIVESRKFYSKSLQQQQTITGASYWDKPFSPSVLPAKTVDGVESSSRFESRARLLIEKKIDGDSNEIKIKHLENNFVKENETTQSSQKMQAIEEKKVLEVKKVVEFKIDEKQTKEKSFVLAETSQSTKSKKSKTKLKLEDVDDDEFLTSNIENEDENNNEDESDDDEDEDEDEDEEEEEEEEDEEDVLLTGSINLLFQLFFLYISY
jgi:hypothetical protein